jgi:hypothetical protein
MCGANDTCAAGVVLEGGIAINEMNEMARRRAWLRRIALLNQMSS